MPKNYFLLTIPAIVVANMIKRPMARAVTNSLAHHGSFVKVAMRSLAACQKILAKKITSINSHIFIFQSPFARP